MTGERDSFILGCLSCGKELKVICLDLGKRHVLLIRKGRTFTFIPTNIEGDI